MIWIFLLAGAAAAPFAFSYLWTTKRWFRIIWWVAILYIIGGFVHQISN